MCETIRDENGRVTATVCGGHRMRKRCAFCSTGYVEKLCDFPVGRRGTCDAGICTRCAKSVGPDRDFCPRHAKAELPSEQGSLFAEAR
jgi:hypothetical protein